jgi:hypothetical protein
MRHVAHGLQLCTTRQAANVSRNEILQGKQKTLIFSVKK